MGNSKHNNFVTKPAFNEERVESNCPDQDVCPHLADSYPRVVVVGRSVVL